jgi:hypothetical protein
LFKTEAKVDITHVPYKGAAPALTDVMAGHVHMMFATAASVVPHIRSGKVRALAVTPIRRTAVFPDLATIDELGLKGFDATTWHGLVAPAKRRGTCDALHRATAEALKDPAVRKSLTDLGVDIVGNTPENSPPTSKRKSRNGPRSSRPPAPSWIDHAVHSGAPRLSGIHSQRRDLGHDGFGPTGVARVPE